ncbi:MULTISPECIES: efflux RND transporter periplasmic adaptor subunit [unclassified Polaribacter]|uniref:efflux RND transporter periplasmic adaptor subunit n=1 Tax=unclassified Polaribacter TaxID=196858 RepID=UPI0011BD5D60|nr:MULTISPECIES: efflux RND transporter periplasmic adaptor subunit [unclassified Polaribacter]TXD52827.1 efflux RND transporter periplasmic adaptor subunit [Polaribacter sp. IC063]TXD61704.1 efflux RND transporter periplasmic adaptor subunit [Polaribacter sp. IC066]
MKNIYLSIFITLLLTSCGNKKEVSVEAILATNDLVQIKSKKTEINTKQQALSAQLKKLNDKIDALDVNKNMPLITTYLVKEEVFTHFIELQGNVQTKQNILIYPEMPGILQSVFVTEGQNVSKGQVLAKIDDGGMSQQIAQLEANAQLAKTTYERQKRLWDQKIGSEIQFLQTKTSFEAQQSAVAQLKSQLTKATIRAPFSGIIDAIFQERGTVVAPGAGAEIFRIVNLNNMYIETEVPETYIGDITKNKTVEVNFPVLGETLTSKVRQVGNFINPSNRSFKIEIDVPNLKGNVKPNLTARLKLNDYTSENAVLIPQSIISENAKGEQFIYIIKDKKENNEAIAERLIIETGKTQGDFIEVTKYLAANAEIIMEGARSVTNGQVVKVINK